MAQLVNHDVTTASATTGAPSPSSGLVRLAGIGAIVFAVGAAAANVAVLNPPAWDASGAEVASWVHGHHTALAVTVVVYPLGMLALAFFMAGLLRAARGSGDADASTFAAVGAFGIVAIAALFGAVEIARIALLAADGSTIADAGLFAQAHHLEAGAFALNLAAVAIALVGVTGAAVRTHLAPTWYWPVSIVGLVCGLAAAAQAPAMVDGSAGWQIGFVTFVTWLVLLLIVGIRMIRED